MAGFYLRSTLPFRYRAWYARYGGKIEVEDSTPTTKGVYLTSHNAHSGDWFEVVEAEAAVHVNRGCVIDEKHGGDVPLKKKIFCIDSGSIQTPAAATVDPESYGFA